MSELKQRLRTALLMMAVVLIALFALPPVATWVVIGLAILGGAWEWSAFLHPHRRRLRVAYVLLIGAGLFAAWVWSQAPGRILWLMGAAFLWWWLALAWVMFLPARGGPRTTAAAGVLSLIPAGVALLTLRQDSLTGSAVLLFSLLVILAADVAAYFAGHRFGRHKLAPRVSPGKTWEGVAGGLLGAVGVSIVGASLLGWPVLAVAGLALVSAAFSIVGDLTESLMKRHTGLKDSGHLFPGHGGMLDRLDSLSAGLPVWVLGLVLLGLLPGAIE